MHQLQNPDGSVTSGPRLFTTASVRGILHNAFYTGQIIRRGKPLPDLHEPLIRQEVFDVVQNILTRNSGRSETLQNKPERHYLLKRIIMERLLRDSDVGVDL